MEALEILIIDDNQKLCESLARSFAKRGIKSYYATSSLDALPLFLEKKLGLVILDIVLGHENGIDILQKLLELNPEAQVIMITAYAKIETAVEAIKMGAFDYIEKPVKFEKLLQVVHNAFKLLRLDEENRQFKTKIIKTSSNIITQNETMLNIIGKLKKFALSDLSILIPGESGTGKELLAELIHANSAFAHKEMLKINCASFPDSLLDNELFGHEKGAFTGANTVYQGVFEQAHNNTLFLDEIGDMPLTLQAKILRTIQNHEIRRLGGKENIRVNVRFITATNKHLETLVNQGKFREDLYYRLNAGIFAIPPLRERKEDIALLIKHFIADFKGNHHPEQMEVAPEAMEILLNYDWPGNVRELKNTINYACTASSHGLIEVEDMPAPLRNKHITAGLAIIQQNEKESITQILQDVNFNKRKAAAMLGMSRTTLYNKIRQYNIIMKKPNNDE